MQHNRIRGLMAESDANKEALHQVEHATDSEPIEGGDLLESSELRRQLRETKDREANQRANGREDRKS